MIRQGWIDKGEAVAVVQQCALAGVSRATVYAQQDPKPVDESDLLHSHLIDEEFTRHPFYGSRRMVVFLKTVGHTVNRKRVQRLMRQMGLAGMAPGPNTRRSHPEHKVYPYLLRGIPVVRPNQVWSTDITYIRLAHGFAYLVAIIDWYSRKVLSWRISNSMEAVFCVDCLEEALRTGGKPEIFNSDQGAQFTSQAFTDVLKEKGITISMDGRGRAFDNIFVERLWRNVKYENVYLNGYATMGELVVGLADYFAFYNGERPHQSLGDKTPNVVYQTGVGGGALIVDKFPAAVEEPPVPLRSTGGSSTATARSEATASSKATAKAKETATATTRTKVTPGQRRPAASEVECAA
jgi:putative transposase